MRPLTAETIEMARQGLLASDWCGFSKRDTVNQLCDLALKGLTAPSLKDAPLAELEQANALPDKVNTDKFGVALGIVRAIRAKLKRSPGLGEAPFSDEGWATIEEALSASSIAIGLTPDHVESLARSLEQVDYVAIVTARGDGWLTKTEIQYIVAALRMSDTRSSGEGRILEALRPVVSAIFNDFGSLSRGQALQMLVNAVAGSHSAIKGPR